MKMIKNIPAWLLTVVVLCLLVLPPPVIRAQVTVPATKVIAYAIAAENSGFPVSFINADTTRIYLRNTRGTPLFDAAFSSYTVLDSTYRMNADWHGVLTKRAPGGGFQVALTKTGQFGGNEIVTDNLLDNLRQKCFAFGDSIHIRLDSTAKVGDEFEIKFRTVKPSQ